ncbi:MAG TPA: response regulator transcription factor [Bryobacteraceae bacterium]|jgi:DNA-binding NarL/FixJ family response regulator
MSNEVRIVIADDHPIVRKGLRQIIEEEPDLRVIGEAIDGEAGIALIEKLQPQVAVLDLDMPKLDGFAVAQEIHTRKLAVQVVFLTIYGEVDLLHRAMDLGAKGYILKESALLEIVSGIRSVAAGRPFVSPSMTPALLEHRARVQAWQQATPSLSDLTPSERRILGMIAEGKSTKLIAAELYVHPRTVETHRASICHKLHLSGTNSLLRFALEHKSELLS